MDFQANKDALNKELERFIALLGEMLPRYMMLLKKQKLDENELKELGEIEHYLIQVNAQIAEIKSKLEQDLFGHTLDTYYKLKKKSGGGDEKAAEKLQKLHDIFQESLDGGTVINWN